MKNIAVTAGVAAFCFAVIMISPVTVISRTLSFQNSPYFLQFERHFWQFILAFIAVVVLSRGHLWSYGINSQNLKTSMIWLSWLYGSVILVTGAAVTMQKEYVPDGTQFLTFGSGESVIASLVYWMSSPVANQILFFSFAQTVLMKHWGDAFRPGGIPMAVSVSSLMFAAGATSSHFGSDPAYLLPTFLFGLFSGTVYWKTNSLITPMLGHAFFFGFPLFIHLLRSGNVP